MQAKIKEVSRNQSIKLTKNSARLFYSSCVIAKSVLEEREIEESGDLNFSYPFLSSCYERAYGYRGINAVFM
jgi:hypothetical protein